MKVFIITGAKGKGKSKSLLNVANFLRKNNIKFSGFLSEPVYRDDKLIGYDIVNLENRRKLELMRKDPEFSSDQCGDFRYRKSSFDFATLEIFESIKRKIDIILLDEIGILETSNIGWHKCLCLLITSNIKFLFLVVRKNLLNEIIIKYNLNDSFIFDVDNDEYSESLINEFIFH